MPAGCGGDIYPPAGTLSTDDYLMASERGGARGCAGYPATRMCEFIRTRALAMGPGLLDMRHNTLGLTDASKLRIKFS